MCFGPAWPCFYACWVCHLLPLSHECLLQDCYLWIDHSFLSFPWLSQLLISSWNQPLIAIWNQSCLLPHYGIVNHIWHGTEGSPALFPYLGWGLHFCCVVVIALGRFPPLSVASICGKGFQVATHSPAHTLGIQKCGSAFGCLTLVSLKIFQ